MTAVARQISFIPIGPLRQRSRLKPFLPFFAHLCMIIITSLVLLCFVNGLHVSTTHRRIQVSQADGSITSSGHKFLQSDITTLVTILASLSRIVGALWARDIAWRCVLLFMEKGGISLQGVNRMLGGFFTFPFHSTLPNQFMFLIILGAIFSSNFYSSVLTGSIIWKPGYTLSQGIKPVGSIARGAAGDSLTSYLDYPEWPTQVKLLSTVMANAAWGNDSADSTSMKRVLPTTRMLPLGSVLTNVTVPYFAVDDFKWVQDPASVLTNDQIGLVQDFGNPSCPFFSAQGRLGLLPDQQWGPFAENNSESMPEPHVENRTRLLVIRTKSNIQPQRCDSDGSDVPQNVGRLSIQNGNHCMVFAQLKIRAGVALCRNCPITSQTVVEPYGKQPLQLAPDPLTSQAIAISPAVSTWMIFTNFGVPTPDGFPDPQHRAVEFLSRSYQASWSSLTEKFGNERDETQVQIAVITSQASVLKWRVWFWVILHLVVLVIGLCFTTWHLTQYEQPWVENPAFGAFCLDTSMVCGILRDMNLDPWLPNSNLPILMLGLDGADSGVRRVVEVMENEDQEFERGAVSGSDQAIETIRLSGL